jgi:hypothetical protein
MGQTALGTPVVWLAGTAPPFVAVPPAPPPTDAQEASTAAALATAKIRISCVMVFLFVQTRSV